MLIIFEGMDNTGKSTQARLLTEHISRRKISPPVLNFHYHRMPTFSQKENEDYYKKQITCLSTLISLSSEFMVDEPILICDRFHFGEYVYGHLYRNYEHCFDYFTRLDEYIVQRFSNQPVYLFLFEDNVKNIVNRDDNLSISNDFNLRVQEKTRFNEAFEFSNISNKYIINVSDQESNMRSKEDILKDIFQGISNSI